MYMCVCVCICMHACMYVCVCVYVCMYVSTSGMPVVLGYGHDALLGAGDVLIDVS
jgi:hypothetical protein